MRPVIIVTLLIRLIFAVKTYDLIYIMTRGGPGVATDLVSYFIYRRAFVSLDLGEASAMSGILLAIILIMTAWLYRYMRAALGNAEWLRSTSTASRKVYAGGVPAVRDVDLDDRATASS